MANLQKIEKLTFDRFCERLDAYFLENPNSKTIEDFESSMDESVYQLLEKNWENAFDFECLTSIFEERGAGVLISNLAINYDEVWEVVLEKCENLPAGATVNFEVWDYIRDGVMHGGTEILRRVITSDGIVEVTK